MTAMMTHMPCLLLAALIAFAVPSAAQNGAEERPRIVSEGATWDFGKKPQWQTLRHGFPIRNGGGGKLLITNVVSGCGCAAAIPTRRELGPGEATEVVVSFETRQFEGVITKFIEVMTNDPETASFRLTVTGFVISPFYAEESPVNLGSAPRGAGLKREFLIHATGDGALRPESIQISNPAFSVGITDRETTPDGGAYRVTVTVPPTMPTGPLRESLTVKTSSPQVPVFSLQLHGRILGVLVAEPRMVTFGSVPEGSGARRSIVVKSNGAAPFRVVSAASSLPCVSCEVKEVEAGRRYEIAAELSANAPAGNHRGQIVIATDGDGEKELRVYFLALVVGKN